MDATIALYVPIEPYIICVAPSLVATFLFDYVILLDLDLDPYYLCLIFMPILLWYLLRPLVSILPRIGFAVFYPRLYSRKAKGNHFRLRPDLDLTCDL